MILLSATPINNDLYDLANQVRLFTQNQPDYFREAGIGDFNAYFRRARKTGEERGRRRRRDSFQLARRRSWSQHRSYIKVAYPNATIKGKPVAFPDRRLHTVNLRPGGRLAVVWTTRLSRPSTTFPWHLTSLKPTKRSRPSRMRTSTSSRRVARNNWSASSRLAS